MDFGIEFFAARERILNRFGVFSAVVCLSLSVFSVQASDATVAYDDAIVSASQFDHGMLQNIEAQYIATFIPSVKVGDSQKDINSLLGTPYSVEHLEQQTRWDYNVSIPTSNATFMGCQYRLEFDADGILKSADWRKSICDLMYRQFVANGANVDHPRIEVFSLMSDVLFNFNEYQLSESGQQEIDQFIDQLLAGYHNPAVTITGHTDYLGSDQANMNLSKLRAREVGKRFLAKDLSQQNLFIKGMGENNPVVVCADEQQDTALINCLMPNRRVEIEIYETP